jgi:DNA-binding NtrC family response regulator
MTRAGYNPTTTTTGEGAMYHIRRTYFDLLVIDLRMPDMRGDVIYHLATSLQPQLRHQTLFITGDVTEQAADLIEACKCPLLMKPFDLRGLEQAVREVAVAAGIEEAQQQRPQLQLYSTGA